MDVLVLGGTAFLGRSVAEHALDRGHRVTCAARGTAPSPAGCSFARIDRDDEHGLAPLAGRRWDAVVDVSRTPRHVQRAVRDLSTAHWVLASSANAYARFDRPEQSEDGPTLPAADDLDDVRDYGRAKVACEELIRAAPATATIVRSGLIGGPGDATRRSGYYPWRFAHPTGGDVLVPGAPDFPVAMIDVDDLAAWIVLASEQRLDSAYNATGLTTTLREAIRLSSDAAGGRATARWVDPAVLELAGVAAWMGPCSLPLWVDDPDWRWFATLDTRAARSAGLTTRPLGETLARALRYETTRAGEHVDDRVRAGLTDADERRVRALLDAGPSPASDR